MNNPMPFDEFRIWFKLGLDNSSVLEAPASFINLTLYDQARFKITISLRSTSYSMEDDLRALYDEYTSAIYRGKSPTVEAIVIDYASSYMRRYHKESH